MTYYTMLKPDGRLACGSTDREAIELRRMTEIDAALSSLDYTRLGLKVSLRNYGHASTATQRMCWIRHFRKRIAAFLAGLAIMAFATAFILACAA